MAKKATGSASSSAAASGSKSKKSTSTSVRNSPIPKAPAAPARPRETASATATISPRRSVSHEEIARKAYEIWRSGRGGSEFENWVRAERELRAAQSN